MHFTSSLAAMVMGGAAFVGLSNFADLMLGHEQFMRVNSIAYENGKIYTDRTIYANRMVADWNVTIVGETRNAPFCKTIAGDGIDQGWSIYSRDKRKTSVLTLDEWVGDDGCADRLTAGQYSMFVTWVPRDGGPPVSATLHFDRK